MSSDAPGHEYRVYLCSRKTCRHPGGQHRGSESQACVLCDCAEWVEGGIGYWSDRKTAAAEAARKALADSRLTGLPL